MTKRRNDGIAYLLVACILMGASAGCDHGTGKASGGTDSAAGRDAGAGPEVVPDTTPDLAPDAVPDGAPDAVVDRAPDAKPDASPPDGRFDLGVESGADATADTRGGGGIEAAGGGADVASDTVADVAGNARSDGASDSGVPADAGLPPYAGLPQPMCVWNEAYQENYAADTVTEILAGAKNCYVLVDPFSDTSVRPAISQMKQNGNLVSCYISVGTCEDWRDDFSAIKPYCVSKQWGEWPGEYFVDRTDPALVALMEARVDKMAAWGCNMVEFDNMDWAFDSANRSQYAITATAAQGEAYNQALCAYTHGKGMGCMAKSSAQGASSFDGLTVESSPGNTDWWTPAHMQGMLTSGKIGIVVHYNESDCAGVRATYQTEYGNKLSFICEDKALKKYRHFP